MIFANNSENLKTTAADRDVLAASFVGGSVGVSFFGKGFDFCKRD